MTSIKPPPITPKEYTEKLAQFNLRTAPILKAITEVYNTSAPVIHIDPSGNMELNCYRYNDSVIKTVDELTQRIEAIKKEIFGNEGNTNALVDE